MGVFHLQTSNQRRVLPQKGRRRLRGYQTYVDSSGLIHIVPRARRTFRVPVVPILLGLGFCAMFKALAMINIGLNDYTSKLSIWQSGSFPERAVALVLGPDPASMWLYQVLQDVI